MLLKAYLSFKFRIIHLYYFVFIEKLWKPLLVNGEGDLSLAFLQGRAQRRYSDEQLKRKSRWKSEIVFITLFLYFWLCWVVVGAQAFSVVECGCYSLVAEQGL